MASVLRLMKPLVRGTWTSARRFSSFPVYNVTKIYHDEEGESHIGSFSVPLDKPGGQIGVFGELHPVNGMMFRWTSGDYNFSWHQAPRRQFIINLDADVEVHTSDGDSKIIEKGQVFFVEDTEGKGHYAKSVDGKPRFSVFLPVPDSFCSS